MIDRAHALRLIAQARQLVISRGSIYYQPRVVSSADLTIMRRIDELHLLYPFAGSRMLRDLLRQEGVDVGRLHVHPARAVMAGVDLARCRVLHRGAGGSAGRYGKPAIFNSDQGSQFTSAAFTAVLHREQIAISMDGKRLLA